MPFTQYLGFDVLEVEPSFDAPRTNFMRSVKPLDSKTGALSVADRTGFPVPHIQQFRWVMETRADVDLWRQFVANRTGACVPFWVPTWRNNFPLSADVAPTDTSITIPLLGYTQFMFPINANHHLAFILNQNRVMSYRKVTAAVANVSTETLTLSSTLGVTIPSAPGGALVCKLQLSRLAVDDPELTWWNSNGVAESILEFIGVPLEVPA